MTPSRLRPSLLGLLAALLGAASVTACDQQEVEKTSLGLMTSLPIYWAEGDQIAAFASGEAETPWVRQSLEERYEIAPLDTLTADGDEKSESGFDPLAGIDRLIIAQPRGLTAADNVALDDWVQAGGRLLLILDPMLAGHYETSITDPRHPITAASIPPVLARWGLRMQFDERQPFQLQQVPFAGTNVPVLMAGELLPVEPDDGTEITGQCTIAVSGVAATCTVGKGRVTVVSDAALLEIPEHEDIAEDMLFGLTDHALESVTAR